MLSPQHQSTEYNVLPAIKVGGEHGMRIPKPKPHKSHANNSPPPMTHFAAAMDTTFKIENTVDPKLSPSYPPKNKENSPTHQESHKSQQRPLNQPR